MRILLIVGWLMIPFGVAIWHYGPGQEREQLDAVANLLARAERSAAAGDWVSALEGYEEALKGMPADRVADSRRIRLLRAKAQMFARQLPAANAELETLVEELKSEGSDVPLLTEARTALANSQYYMTWLMRLEGQPADVWEPEIESARQNYRLLAEQAAGRGDTQACQRNQEDLESAIRLARMDLGELQGLPLPSQ
jgi:hypothetical protein